MLDTDTALKRRVKDHWEAETCGIRYSAAQERAAYFDEISHARYQLEPYIPPFASFPDAAGKTVLEIGVGAGADFEHWCRHAAHATGIDLTEAAIALTNERLQIAGISPDRYTLRTADAEHLPFDDSAFDLVYSWGVLHHTPDTEQAFGEAYRVLKPGGTLRAMIYHTPSWTALLLTVMHVVRHRTLRTSMTKAVFANLESPGTKAYSVAEAKQFLAAIGFDDLRLSPKLAPGDLLTIQFSGKYQSRVYRITRRLYPRRLIRLLGDRFGLNLLVEAIKPSV